MTRIKPVQLKYYGGCMIKSESEEKKSRVVLFSSLVTSTVLVILFLSGAFLTNNMRGAAYSQVDMAAGSIFVFVITMIISLSLWPRALDRFDRREE
ncbi:MAG: hypothetical protein ACPK85_09790 [Methanosarcina sp.]